MSVLGFSALAASYNKSIHSDCQKRRGFRYATATQLLAAGDAKRSATTKGERK